MVRYFNVFVFAAFVFVRRHLTTGDIQFCHQLTGQPAPHFDARAPGNDGRYASGAGGAATGIPGLHDLAALNHTRAVGVIRRSLPVPVAAAMDVKSLTQRSDRISRPQPVDYREPLSESDIKSAVAFFRISFSISRRWNFFFASRSSSCSGVRGSPAGVSPGALVSAYSPTG